MRGSKGFTLVELLAVLVILAIIALITTPIILGVIDKARKDGAKDKAWGYINAIEVAFARNQADLYPVNLPYTSEAGSSAIIKASEDPGKGSKVAVSGQTPESGQFKINSEGAIEVYQLEFDNYYCTSDVTSTKMCCDQSAATSASACGQESSDW